YYIDGKQVTLDPEGTFLTARLFLDMLKDTRVDAVGGLTLGADPIAASMAAISYVEDNPIKAFIVRKTPKKHGMQRYIEGPNLDSSSRVAIVDDVVTTGGSILKAIEVVEKQGCKVVKVLAIVDRLEGARENLAEKGYRLVSLFTRNDLLRM
ncbi:MAG: orotate phosphoribosyltransferase, partial [Nitrospinae bacterium]|nr:orotate phosphoribosyltransferase [Nitrospinota bacterium]